MTAISHPTREQWLLARRALAVTASDAAACLTLDATLAAMLLPLTGRDAFTVWAEKVYGTEQDETEAMVLGKETEDGIARAYERLSGRPVRNLGEFEIQQAPGVPWIGATLDRVTAVPSGEFPCVLTQPHHVQEANMLEQCAAPLQLKRAIGRARDWKDGVPLHVQVQVQVEPWCYGSSWAAIGADLGTSLARPDVLLDVDMIQSFLPLWERFKWHIETRTPPEPSHLPAAREAIKKLWPGADGETKMLLDDETLALADQLEAAREDKRTAERVERARWNELMVRREGASFVRLKDGSVLKFPLRQRKAHEVEATEFRVLERWRPGGRR